MSINWELPQNLLQTSIELMALHGQYGNEGLALWLGKESGRYVTVSHVLELTGPGFRTSPLNLRISLAGMSALTNLADQLGVYLVGQIHSHPGTFVDLSDVDRIFGIRVPDYLSLVCPHYAQVASTSLKQCGVHVFEGPGYRQLSSMEVARCIVTSDKLVTKITVEIPA